MLPRPSIPPGHPDIQAGRFIQTAPWKVYIGNGRWLAMLPNSEGDGMTFPEVARDVIEKILGKDCKWSHDYLAAVHAHDALYGGELVSREEADGIFFHLLRSSGVDHARARLMFEAVRKLGWIVWDRHSEASVAAWRKVARVFADAPA